jgi:DNA topoisomerase-1
VPEALPVKTSDAEPTPEQAAAEEANLVYLTDDVPGIRRRGSGRGFYYVDPKGTTIRDEPTLARIRALAIPPAWTDVWISPNPRGHVQATGRDAKGRKQYRYHTRWAEARGETKYERLAEIARLLPRIRERIERDLARPPPSRERVLATVVRLLETTLIRIGNKEYAAANDSYGLTTLRDEHVEVAGTELRFEFRGKSGKTWQLALKDRRIAKTVRTCQELPGQHLFQYLDGGEQVAITSTEVNAYLREASGSEITAKDIRTWAGTVLAAGALAAAEEPRNATHAKKLVSAAIKQVAQRLGNTPAIARKSYVHPAVIEAYSAGLLADAFRQAHKGDARLNPEERAVLALLDKASGSDRQSRAA